ncbi:MAG TPA: FAD-dependent oxidoreductase, partial [Flavobacteriales bacterium]|nr:FAD-dependent oxidoreductase [Flavobacteriales bacterium]
MATKERMNYDNLPYPMVVVVGGGFGGLEVVQRLANKPFKVLLLDKQNHHCFQPLLYQVATASLSADSIAHPFRRTIAPMPNVAFRMAMVTGVRPADNVLETDHGEIPYDILVITTGSTTNFFGNKPLEDQAMQLKSISQALDIRSDFLQDFEAALYLREEQAQRRQLNFVIVGGGPTGVELAGAMAEIRKTVLKHE